VCQQMSNRDHTAKVGQLSVAVSRLAIPNPRW
jgi:hypothetical protein